MKKKKIVITSAIVIITIPFLILSYKYREYKKELYEQPAYLELFLGELYGIEDSPWDDVDESNKRPIKWLLNKAEFEKLDSVYLGFQNTSSENLFYMTWGEPTSRLRIDYIIYKKDSIERIPFGGFGCGTGIFLEKSKSNETIGRKNLNPLMFNPYSNYELPIVDKDFPKIFREIYGDSVAIRFQQATHSSPWNKYPSQMIYSDYIVIPTEKVIQNWKKGLYRPFPKREPIE